MNMTQLPRPVSLTWDINYACQLRCIYCYSESGRRKEKRLSTEDIFRVVDALTSAPLEDVQISGGEPTLVAELPEVLRRLRLHIPKVRVFTNGQELDTAMAEALVEHATHVHVSLDGGDALVNDSIRGHKGAFDAAIGSLSLLNRTVKQRREKGLPSAQLGIDTVIVRGNFRHLEALCTHVAARFDELSFVFLGAAVPAGSGSEQSFCEQSLLHEDEVAELRDPAFTQRLRSAAPGIELLGVTDNFGLLFSPERIAAGQVMAGRMHVEPDAGVRALPPCEGTVGNLLEEPLDRLWARAWERIRDPYIAGRLSGITTLRAWALAVRDIDRHFASEDTLIRLRRRGPSSAVQEASHDEV